jgi:hypothetical protein
MEQSTDPSKSTSTTKPSSVQEMKLDRAQFILDKVSTAPHSYYAEIPVNPTTRKDEINYLTSMSRKAKTQHAKQYKFTPRTVCSASCHIRSDSEIVLAILLQPLYD